MSASFTQIHREGKFGDLVAGSATLGSSAVQNSGLVGRGRRVQPLLALAGATNLSITAANLFSPTTGSNWWQCSPTGAVNYNFPTAALMAVAWESAYGAAPVAGDSWELYIINTHATNVITVVGATGVTIVGSAEVNGTATAEASNSSAHFQLRWTSGTACVLYRLS